MPSSRGGARPWLLLPREEGVGLVGLVRDAKGLCTKNRVIKVTLQSIRPIRSQNGLEKRPNRSLCPTSHFSNRTFCAKPTPRIAQRGASSVAAWATIVADARAWRRARQAVASSSLRVPTWIGGPTSAGARVWRAWRRAHAPGGLEAVGQRSCRVGWGGRVAAAGRRSTSCKASSPAR